MTTLNKPTEKYKRYTVYEGAFNARMQDLLKDGRVPMNFAQVMLRRVEVPDQSTPTDVRDAWWNNYVSTGDGARRHPDGSLKIAYDSSTLRSLTPTSALHQRALLLTPDEYATGDGPAFTPAQVDQYTGNHHTSIDAVLANPIWCALARDDKALLREYAQTIFAQYDHPMAIWAPRVQELPVERLWVVGSLSFNYRGGAIGIDYILGNFGRLVGVAPEARAPTTAQPDQPERRAP